MAKQSTKVSAAMAVIALYSTTIAGGEIKPPGSAIELPEDEARDGIERGLFAEPGSYQAASPGPAARPADSADVIAAITQELRGWSDADLGDEEKVTATGKPIVAVLEKQLGYDITAAERDAAIDALKASLV